MELLWELSRVIMDEQIVRTNCEWRNIYVESSIAVSFLRAHDEVESKHLLA